MDSKYSWLKWLVWLRFAAFALAIFWMFRQQACERCEMTSMMAMYEEVPIASPLSWKYKLYHYDDWNHQKRRTIAEGLDEDEHCIPLLFAPGNAGSYRQVRSLATTILEVAATQSIDTCISFFTVDFHGEVVAFSHKLIEDQSAFLASCLDLISARFSKGPRQSSKGTSVILIGHSFGGIALSLMHTRHLRASQKAGRQGDSSALPSSDCQLLDRALMVTLSSPHQRHPLAPSLQMNALYAELQGLPTSAHAHGSKSDLERPQVTRLAISSGHSDIMVPPRISQWQPKSQAVNIALPQITLSWSDPHHQAVIWEKRFVTRLAMLLVHSIEPAPNAKRLISTEGIVQNASQDLLGIYKKAITGPKQARTAPGPQATVFHSGCILISPNAESLTMTRESVCQRAAVHPSFGGRSQCVLQDVSMGPLSGPIEIVTGESLGSFFNVYLLRNNKDLSYDPETGKAGLADPIILSAQDATLAPGPSYDYRIFSNVSTTITASTSLLKLPPVADGRSLAVLHYSCPPMDLFDVLFYRDTTNWAMDIKGWPAIHQAHHDSLATRLRRSHNVVFRTLDFGSFKELLTLSFVLSIAVPKGATQLTIPLSFKESSPVVLCLSHRSHASEGEALLDSKEALPPLWIQKTPSHVERKEYALIEKARGVWRSDTTLNEGDLQLSILFDEWHGGSIRVQINYWKTARLFIVNRPALILFMALCWAIAIEQIIPHCHRRELPHPSTALLSSTFFATATFVSILTIAELVTEGASLCDLAIATIWAAVLIPLLVAPLHMVARSISHLFNKRPAGQAPSEGGARTGRPRYQGKGWTLTFGVIAFALLLLFSESLQMGVILCVYIFKGRLMPSLIIGMLPRLLEVVASLKNAAELAADYGAISALKSLRRSLTSPTISLDVAILGAALLVPLPCLAEEEPALRGAEKGTRTTPSSAEEDPFAREQSIRRVRILSIGMTYAVCLLGYLLEAATRPYLLVHMLTGTIIYSLGIDAIAIMKGSRQALSHSCQ